MLQEESPTTTAPSSVYDEAAVQEMLLLATRLKQQHGEDLDDAAIQAVCEATGTPPEYVRLVLQSTQVQQKQSFAQRARSVFLGLDPDVRRYVSAAWLACATGLASALAAASSDRSSLFAILSMVGILAACYNCTLAKDQRVGSASGAIFGGLWFISTALFLSIVGWFRVVPHGERAEMLILYLLGGAFAGGLCRRKLGRTFTKLGIRDAATERQELLTQLVELQDRLRTGEQSMTFLSVDIVGSTRMKQQADPLAIEFTFTEYHKYVDAVIRRYGGDMHSTAGDGVTCAFDTPLQAFQAARNIQSGLIELNTHRNKLGMPIRLRAAIHHGTVLVAPGQAVSSVNFSEAIDIAAHLQKECPEGCVAVSAAAASLIPGGASIIGAERVSASGADGVVWRPKASLATVPVAQPPPGASLPPAR